MASGAAADLPKGGRRMSGWGVDGNLLRKHSPRGTPDDADLASKSLSFRSDGGLADVPLTAASKLIDSLSEAQLAELGELAATLPTEEHTRLGAALLQAGRRYCRHTKGKLNEGSGAAFEAFGERAVAFGYITQQQLDRIRKRLVDTPAPQREGAIVAALRRFLAFTQPLGHEVRLVGCPIRADSAPEVDLNGLRAQCEPSTPPGGTPEMYNVLVQLPSDETPETLVVVQPKYLRPIPIDEDTRDPNAEPIPEDGEPADTWYTNKVIEYEKDSVNRLALQLAGKGGPVFTRPR
ncbi:hypothetical protein AB1Y20_022536 [Prymnesium parvum]|uniref:Uncharacterized protein n=1 Tax=Prymnesium parvum TaxID=97485 RepID=A0AB34JJ51_PRYPA